MKVVIDDYRLEKMDSYTEPLEAKIKRQAAEITRLLKENAELKKDNLALSVDVTGCKNMAESARAAGQEEAWKLAHKMSRMGFDEAAECFPDYDFPLGMRSLTKKYSYAEAAAKVAEWERKNEICVGDVLLSKTIREKCIVTSFSKSENTTYILWNDCSYGRRATNKLKEEFEKIGHIDVDAWLAQIGGE